MLGEKWKGLNEKQKAPYEAKAAADKKRYEEEKAAYTAVSLHPCRPLIDTSTDISNRVAKTRRSPSRRAPLSPPFTIDICDTVTTFH